MTTDHRIDTVLSQWAARVHPWPGVRAFSRDIYRHRLANLPPTIRALAQEGISLDPLGREFTVASRRPPMPTHTVKERAKPKPRPKPKKKPKAKR